LNVFIKKQQKQGGVIDFSHNGMFNNYSKLGRKMQKKSKSPLQICRDGV